MSWDPLGLPGSRNLLWCRSWRLGGGLHQPISSTWAVGSQKPTTCILACWCVTSLQHPWFRVRNSGHQLGGVLIPLTYGLTHSLSHLIGSGIVQCVGESFTVAGLMDGVASDLGVDPPAVVECCWLLSLFGMVALDHTRGHVAMEVGEFWSSHHSSLAPSGHSRKPAKLVGELPRSSCLVRLNHTSLCVGLLGEHATLDSCGDCEHHTVHVGVIPIQVGLAPSPGDSCWCSCSSGQLEVWCSHSSLSWEHGGIGKDKTCLEGHMEGVHKHASLWIGPVCGGIWCHCCCLALLYEYLHVGWEQEEWLPHWTLSKTGAVHLSCGYTHVLMVSRWGPPFDSWGSMETLLALCGACGQGLARTHSGASMLLWRCGAFMPAGPGDDDHAWGQEVPVKGHGNMLYPWIGICLSM